MYQQGYGQPQGFGQQGDGFANYGAAFEQPMGYEQPFKQSPFRSRRNAGSLPAILTCLFVPFFIFVVVMAVQTFSIHYNNAQYSKVLCFLLLAICAMFGYFAVAALRRKMTEGTEPAWYIFLFVTSTIGWIIAFSIGGNNFQSNMKPYFDMQQMNTYVSVDPTTYRGMQLMDAGRITFTPGARLDLTRSMGFRNLDTYCVAPVVGPQGRNASMSLDFWAVGLNCCSGHAPDFHCGEYNNPRALSGLRLMRDDQRAFFRLAVQQAEAAYGLQAMHPIFMYWMQDPAAEVNAYQDDGYKFFIVGCLGFFIVQLVLILAAAITFTRMYSN